MLLLKSDFGTCPDSLLFWTYLQKIQLIRVALSIRPLNICDRMGKKRLNHHHQRLFQTEMKTNKELTIKYKGKEIEEIVYYDLQSMDQIKKRYTQELNLQLFQVRQVSQRRWQFTSQLIVLKVTGVEKSTMYQQNHFRITYYQNNWKLTYTANYGMR